MQPKPEYLFRPSQIVRRLFSRFPHEKLRVRLPWGSNAIVDPSDDIGRCVVTSGVYELEICEAIFRLLDQGETAIDAGANIGLMTAAMAMASGPSGRVISFEPNPIAFDILQTNSRLWGADHSVVELRAAALSSCQGEATIHVPPRGFRNLGAATLLERGIFDAQDFTVKTARLDELFSSEIGVLKVDVEGHEEALFQGAFGLLAAGKIRDIIFEDFARVHPNPVGAMLSQHGYKIFRLAKRWWGPSLLPAESSGALTLVASLQPERLAARFKHRGWKSLSFGRRTALTPPAVS